MAERGGHSHLAAADHFAQVVITGTAITRFTGPRALAEPVTDLDLIWRGLS